MPSIAKDVFEKSISEGVDEDMSELIENLMKEVWVNVDQCKAVVKSLKIALDNEKKNCVI